MRLRRVLMPSTHIRLFGLMSSGRRIRRRSRSRDDPIRCDPIPIPIPISIPILFLNVSDCDCDSPFRIARLVVVACLELGVIRRQALGP